MGDRSALFGDDRTRRPATLVDLENIVALSQPKEIRKR
jgi:hypothetical protein